MDGVQKGIVVEIHGGFGNDKTGSTLKDMTRQDKSEQHSKEWSGRMRNGKRGVRCHDRGKKGGQFGRLNHNQTNSIV